MSDSDLAEDVYLKMVCDFLRDNQEWYLKRFGYAACELWLCSEICNILNFDHNASLDKLNKFCFNEIEKRDLTIYENTANGLAKMLSHIEVKLLYPAYQKSKKKGKLDELVKKLSSDSEKLGKSGWIFMVWTSANAGSYKESSDFFNDAFEEIKKYFDMKNNDYVTSSFGVIDIIGDVFGWRGGEKEIIVKAIAVNHIPEN
ncbi:MULTISPECIES: hypothetical protein [Pectobacterium]|uniref:hypothetical protein n=1 Tax=Pectobacterium TaxID=122277 RepID=UPI0005801A2B|nr:MULTISPECIES: hypothetical protein [Pectobacterium]KHS78711.1 hypothetical protein RC84_19605 [Pectobacterium carotovorum subsp. carotovorum]KHT36908.1 hypothetical protein RC99_05215 [Pectobacterium carotovorum subsp. carotovorum]POE17354.1 hypothetical protein BV923_22760 [Pectobacterium odoriferum]